MEEKITIEFTNIRASVIDNLINKYTNDGYKIVSISGYYKKRWFRKLVHIVKVEFILTDIDSQIQKAISEERYEDVIKLKKKQEEMTK